MTPAADHDRHLSAKVLRVGIFVDFSDGWLGGLNYFKNLIRAVDDVVPQRLEFVVFTGSKVDEKLLANWPLEIVRDAMFDRFGSRWIARKLFQKFLLSDPLLQALLVRQRIDVLSHSGYLGRRSDIPCIGWIPDFQHIHLPDVFRRWDIVRRNAEIERIVLASTSVVVSSMSACADLLQIAPQANTKVEVLRFVGEAPQSAEVVAKELLQRRYGFDGDYVFLPNQYWSHKNHLTVIRAVAALKAEGNRLTVISTGKTADFRQPEFFDKVSAAIQQLGVAAEYKVLGIVPYDDVVSLMHHCAFVINPSRFEGWSTTVEESKAAGKHILLSDIPVHREQAPASADFFAATDVTRLQTLLWQRWINRAELDTASSGSPSTRSSEHAVKRRMFADEYLAIVERAMQRVSAK